jgi:hypothetical protein
MATELWIGTDRTGTWLYFAKPKWSTAMEYWVCDDGELDIAYLSNPPVPLEIGQCVQVKIEVVGPIEGH